MAIITLITDPIIQDWTSRRGWVTESETVLDLAFTSLAVEDCALTLREQTRNKGFCWSQSPDLSGSAAKIFMHIQVCPLLIEPCPYLV